MILVTGGSGFVGSHLLPRLVKEGYQVRCLVRNNDEVKQVNSYGADASIGSVNDVTSLEAAMLEVESVIHLVAIIRQGKGATFQSVNVEGTKNVLEAAKNGKVKRFIHIGALGAKPNPYYDYLYSKWQGEEMVRSSKLNYTILKPSVMFGEGAGFIEALIRSIHLFPLITPIAGNGNTKLQPIWVEDTVSCILLALKGKKQGESIDIGGSEQFTYKQVLQIISKALGSNRLKVHIPLWLMRPSISLMEILFSNPPITSGELKALTLDNTTDVDAVEKHFCFIPLSIREEIGYLKS